MKAVILGTMVVLNNILNPGQKLFSQSAKRKRKGMALIKTGGGVAQISGSIAGTVFSRNRYGSYARNRTVPVNPNTPLQQKVRSAIALLSNQWFNSITAAQRQAWATYADNVTVSNRLGDAINLTGFNQYVRSNTALVNADLTEVDDAPTDFTLAEQDPTLAVAISEATQQASITFDANLPWVDETGGHMIVSISRPQNATINFFKGPYNVAGTIDGDGTTPPTSPGTISVPFPVVAGQKVFVQCRIVRADGRLSEPFRQVGVCAA
jgi:hypothetical protein